MADLKFGTVDGRPDFQLHGITGTLATSSVLPAKSGRLLVYDVSDATWGAIATDAAAICGYTDTVIASASAAGTKVPIFSVKGKVFEMPFARSGAAATLTQAILDAIIGLQIDSYVASNIQYADDANAGSIGTQHCYLVEGGNVASNTLYVSIVDANILSKA